jgi:putative DNA primase/helicase
LPGDDYNERADHEEELKRWGWTYAGENRKGVGSLWARPGKDVSDGHSAILYPNGNLLNFSASAHPLPQSDKRAITPFSRYIAYDHKGDVNAAVKALAKAGYGDQRQAKNGKTEAKAEQKTETAATPGPAVVVAHNHVLDSIQEKVGPVDFLQLFKDAEIDAIKQKHYLVASIEQLLKLVKEQSYQLARKNDFVFAFNGEFWRQIEREDLKDFLMAVAQKQGIPALEAKHYEFRDKLYKQFLALASLRTPEPAADEVLINLLNGTFGISTAKQELREFRAADFLTHQLNFKYDKDATAPKFKAYLDRVLPEQELQDIVAEFFGYVFTKNLKLEKALLLYGSGANGKSVLFDVMNALLGRDNTANYSLADLMEEHNRAQIAHKLLNYGSEINAAVTKDVFKNLVSGEPIMARLKYGNSFLMERYSKLSFNCNELPKDIEQTDAYFRRLLIIPFRVTIPEREWVTDLAQQIIDEELTGVFNWLLDGLNRILSRKKFTESKIVKEMVAEYRRESDSVACWLSDENWGPDPHNLEHTTKLKVLHMSYQTYCREAGHKPLGRNNFKKRLTHNGIAEAVDNHHGQEFYINHLGSKA